MEKEQLQKMYDEIYNDLNDSSKDFVDDHNADDSVDLYDAFTEFADSRTSIYYSDQRQYYNEHTEECERALLELYDSNSIADYIKKNGLDGLICHAGAVGEYEAIYRELSEDDDKIVQCLMIKYLMDYCEQLSADDVDTCVTDLCANDVGRISDIKTLAKNYELL